MRVGRSNHEILRSSGLDGRVGWDVDLSELFVSVKGKGRVVVEGGAAEVQWH